MTSWIATLRRLKERTVQISRRALSLIVASIFLIGITTLLVPTMSNAEALTQFTGKSVSEGIQSPEPPIWQAVRATNLPYYESTALTKTDLIIGWTTPTKQDIGQKDYRIAKEAFLLADGNQSVVEPQLKKALSSLGKFKFTTTETKLGCWDADWFEVLVSRRPDLCKALFERCIKPTLDEISADSHLSPEDKKERARWTWRNHISGLIPQDRAPLPEFQSAYQVTQAVLSKKYGFLFQSESNIAVEIMDVSAAFGRPMISVRIQQSDTSPNVGSGLRNFFNLGSLGRAPEPSTDTIYSVPSTVLDVVRTVLISNSGEDKVRVAASPSEWALTREFCNFENSN
jgi:hypothetical protein